MQAGETFGEPGEDAIHYLDGNARHDIAVRFLVMMRCAPSKPMPTLVAEDELVARQDRHASASN